MRARRVGLGIGIGVAACLGLLLAVESIILAGVLAARGEHLPFGSKVALVRVEEVLLDARPFVATCKDLEENAAVKAVVIRLESPGGSVAASQEMYEAVRRLRRSGKHVIASVGNVGASGAYYVAAGADTIMANPGSIVGSIGVLASFLNLGDLYQKLGIDPYSVTSGRFKALGETSRRLDAEERRLIQELIDDAYGQFLEAVIEGRRGAIAARIEKDEAAPVDVEAHLRRFADGRILTGRQALEAGLVDSLGTQRDAIEAAARTVGIQGEPTVIVETPGRRHEGLFGAALSGLARAAGLPDLPLAPPVGPGLYYLWRPAL